MKLHELSFVLIQYILENLENIDRICLVLICKRLFDNRDKFLSFNDKSLPTLYKFDNSKCYLNSFKPQIRRSIQYKSLCTAYFLNSTQSEYNNDELVRLKQTFDYIIFGKDNDYLNNLDSYPNSLRRLSISINDLNTPGLVLPKSITDLICLGDCVSIGAGAIPSNIVKLKFTNFVGFFEDGAIPQSVRHLEMSPKYAREIKMNMMPAKLERLSITNLAVPIAPGALPSSLKYLAVGNMNLEDLQDGCFPDSLEQLHIGSMYTKPFKSLPQSLTHLTIKYLNMLPKSNLPPRLRNIKVIRFAQPEPIEQIQLPCLETLKIASGHRFYYQEVVKKQGLFSISFKKKEVKSLLPPNIKSLRLGKNYNEPILPGAIPDTVRELALGEGYFQHMGPGSIPTSVETLECGRFPFAIEVPYSVREIHYPNGLESPDFFMNLISVSKYRLNLSDQCQLTLYRERQNPTVFIALDQNLLNGLYLSLRQLKKIIQNSVNK